MKGNWSKNPEAFKDSLKYSEALRDAVVALDMGRIQAILAEPNFRHDAITPAVIGKAHRRQQTDMVVALMAQATAGVRQSVITEMSRVDTPTADLMAMVRAAPSETQATLVSHAIFKGFHFKREAAYFLTLLDEVPLSGEDLKDPLLKWAAAQEWALVEHALGRMVPTQVPWGDLLVRLSKEGSTPSDALLSLTLTHTHDEKQRNTAFNSAARTGNLAMLNHMMAEPQGWTPPFEHAFEAAWIKKQDAIIDRLLPLTNFDQVGALLAARIPRQVNTSNKDPDKVTWETLDRLGPRIPLVVQERWLALYPELPMTQASARQQRAYLDEPKNTGSRTRLRRRS